MSNLTRLTEGESAWFTYEPAATGFRLTTWPPFHSWTPPADEPDIDVNVTDIADLAGLHCTTVSDHIENLEELGVIEEK